MSAGWKVQLGQAAEMQRETQCEIQCEIQCETQRVIQRKMQCETQREIQRKMQREMQREIWCMRGMHATEGGCLWSRGRETRKMERRNGWIARR